MDALRADVRRLARGGERAPIRLEVSQEEQAAVEELCHAAPLPAAVGLIQLASSHPSPPALAGLAVMLVRLDEAALGAMLLRGWLEDALPDVMRAVEAELWRSPVEAARMGLRSPPPTGSDEIPLCARPTLGLGANDPADQALLETLCRRLGELGRLEEVQLVFLEGARAAPHTWVDLIWTSAPQERPFVVPLFTESGHPEQFLADLALGQHLWETWTPDPGLILAPLSKAFARILELRRSLLVVLPPWYAENPDLLRRALYREAPCGLPALLQGWEGSPMRVAALAEASLTLLARGVEAQESGTEALTDPLNAALTALSHPWLVGAPSHRMAAARALHRALLRRARQDTDGGYAVPLRALGTILAEGGEGGGARFAGGSVEVERWLRADPVEGGEPVRAVAPIRLFRTLDHTWAVAESHEAGLALRAVLDGVLSGGRT